MVWLSADKSAILVVIVDDNVFHFITHPRQSFMFRVIDLSGLPLAHACVKYKSDLLRNSRSIQLINLNPLDQLSILEWPGTVEESKLNDLL